MVKGGSQTVTKNIQVVKEVREGFFVTFVECQGGNLIFKGSGAGRGNNMAGDITAVATDSDGNEIASSNTIYLSDGTFQIFLPGENFESGDYTLKVSDGRKKVSIPITSTC